MDVKIEFDRLDQILARRGLDARGKVQQYVDSEVIRLCDPYVPLKTGFLKNDSPIIGTQIGSGLVVYEAPYARRQYYTHKGKGLRGPKWFERMKAAHLGQILRGAADVAGGDVEK